MISALLLAFACFIEGGAAGAAPAASLEDSTCALQVSVSAEERGASGLGRGGAVGGAAARAVDPCVGEIKMASGSFAVTNNLGGLGPTVGPPVIHISPFLELADGRNVDITIANLSDYGSNNPSINGVEGEFLNLNIRAGFVDLLFTFSDTETGVGVTMPPFKMTIYDLDGPGRDPYAEMVMIDTFDFSNYQLSSNTEVVVSVVEDKTHFGSSKIGEACDNPTSIESLGTVVCNKSGTVDQAARAVALTMKGGVPNYHISLRASDVVTQGRNFLFGVPAYFNQVCKVPDFPTPAPTDAPTKSPTLAPSSDPTASPTSAPTHSPTPSPPTSAPTHSPTTRPTDAPTHSPTPSPTDAPTASPTLAPTHDPTPSPTDAPTASPTLAPTHSPTTSPTDAPTHYPTPSPTAAPTASPTLAPTHSPTPSPPTSAPTHSPTGSPTDAPTASPTSAPTGATSFGDPHVSNLKGQRFEILKPDYHTFLMIPRGAEEEKALLHVQAKVEAFGELCNSLLYVTGLRFSGQWLGDVRSLDFATRVDAGMLAEKAITMRAGSSLLRGISEFRATVPAALAEITEMHPEEPQHLNQHATTLQVKLMLGPAVAKVWMVYQREKAGFTNSLWFTTTGLHLVEQEIGGILGLDDHRLAAGRPAECGDASFLGYGRGRRGGMLAEARW